jgi:RNA polymerase sigma-70 factor (ECF subfamily)
VDDAALVRRMLRGDESAFDEFFDAYFDRVFRFAARRMDDDDAAQDVAQATLVAAVRKLETWRGEAALFTWLCAICRRELAAQATKATKEHKRTQRGAARALDDGPEVRAVLEQIASGGDSPERAYERAELARVVQLALDYLPDRYGDLLEWKYIEGRAVAEIAARLQSTPKAVESMLTRAREAFREAFAELTRATERS